MEETCNIDGPAGHGALHGVQAYEYQLEMLRESMRRNIIVAMDTGSGKTIVSLLRINAELERAKTDKIIWFLCPTVALCEQQQAAVQRLLPSVTSRVLCGRDGVDTWTNQEAWNEALRDIKVVVCTHQVLLDALTHGFVLLSGVSLLIFDEAHHCTKRHPACRIMTDFYHKLRVKDPGSLPMILGLTASPIVRNNKESLQTIEYNLDAISRTPKTHWDDLQSHVHRPIISTIFFSENRATDSPLLEQLIQIYLDMEIEEDPYVIGLKQYDYSLYEKTINSRKTYCQANVKRFVTIARKVLDEFGAFLAECYIISCVRLNVKNIASLGIQIGDMNEEECRYLLKLLTPLDVAISPSADGQLSPKLWNLLNLLNIEMDVRNTTGIVFVETRSATRLLADFLSSHPFTRDKLRIGTFVGLSQIHSRSFKISELVNVQGQEDTLQNLKSGKLNLLICTNVCEEGIDISACNLVVCFDPPKNLKSFIQIRGRARMVESKFYLMYQEGGPRSLNNWIELEKEMINLYTDETRELGEVEEDELELDGHRDFTVEATGAKITILNAVQHLYHFCDKLPHVQYTKLAPIFTYEGSDEDYSCEVLLPSTVHATVQSFSSSRSWRTPKLARMEAAFEAYIGLYKAGLVNDNLLPSDAPDITLAKEYETIAKRQPFAEAGAQTDPWISVASLWQAPWALFQCEMHVIDSIGDLDVRLKVLTPCPLNISLPATVDLFSNAKSTLKVTFSKSIKIETDNGFVSEANEITKLILASVFGQKMMLDKIGFPLLFVPLGVEDYTSWLRNMSGAHPATALLDREADIGIIRYLPEYRQPFRLLRIESCEIGEESNSGFLLRCLPLSRRIKSLHISAEDSLESSTTGTLLDPQLCEVDKLPLVYASFARLVPSIMHRIEVELVAKDLCDTVLASVELTSFRTILEAISTPSTGELLNYQRLEFLGDCILKTLASIHIFSDNPTWHEGHMSIRKDHLVSNSRLGKAAQDTGLVPYILTKQFTSRKWRPAYNDELLSRHKKTTRAMSTKMLADVIEALVGAAYLDGAFLKALKTLNIFLPEISWEPVANKVEAILETTASQSFITPSGPKVKELETILGREFTYKQLLMEAITHPSYISALSTVASYQRLEFLGDALLDYIVTTTIYRHPGTMPVHRMHLLRTAAVNASFLAFCALSTTISLPVAKLQRVVATRSSQSHDPQTTGHGEEMGAFDASTSFPVEYEQLSLPHYLRFSLNAALASALAATRNRFKYLAPMISVALGSSRIYPWRLLAALNAEKVFSDLVESALAAVWIDSRGDFGACENLLRKFGILGWLERALEDDVKVLHPKQEVGLCAGDQRVRYLVLKDDQDRNPLPVIESEGNANGHGTRRRVAMNGAQSEEEVEEAPEVFELGQGRWSCRISVGEEEIAVAQGWNRIEAETAAAEKAVAILRTRKMFKNDVAPSSNESNDTERRDDIGGSPDDMDIDDSSDDLYTDDIDEHLGAAPTA